MWQPRPKTQEILARGWYWIKSVPYSVSTRWLFYKLYDFDHFFGGDKKKAYHNLFMPLFSKARKLKYENWRPDSLIDESRQEFLRGFGWEDEREWLERGISEECCTIDKWQYAENYVELLFEAFAMKGQFSYFAPGITLVPFRGDASIEYKWRIAKRLEQMARRYEKPIKILYFGDLDRKGQEIPENALKDIRDWCSVPFAYTRCGLNPGDEDRFGLGADIDHPGSYQWESLSHEQAGDIIKPAVDSVVDQEIIKGIQKREQEITRKFREKFEGIIEDILD